MKIQITRKNINEMVYAAVKGILREWEGQEDLVGSNERWVGRENDDDSYYGPNEDYDDFDDRDERGDVRVKIPNTEELFKEYVNSNYPDLNADELYYKISGGNKTGFINCWRADRIEIIVYEVDEEEDGNITYDWKWIYPDNFDGIKHWALKDNRFSPEGKAFFGFISVLSKYIDNKISEVNESGMICNEDLFDNIEQELHF